MGTRERAIPKPSHGRSAGAVRRTRLHGLRFTAVRCVWLAFGLALAPSGCALLDVHARAARSPVALPNMQSYFCWAALDAPAPLPGSRVPCLPAGAEGAVQACRTRLQQEARDAVSLARAREQLQDCMFEAGFELTIWQTLL